MAERLREEEGLSLRDAVRQAAKELGLSRNELYRLAVEQEKNGPCPGKGRGRLLWGSWFALAAGEYP